MRVEECKECLASDCHTLRWLDRLRVGGSHTVRIEEGQLAKDIARQEHRIDGLLPSPPHARDLDLAGLHNEKERARVTFVEEVAAFGKGSQLERGRQGLELIRRKPIEEGRAGKDPHRIHPRMIGGALRWALTPGDAGP